MSVGAVTSLIEELIQILNEARRKLPAQWSTGTQGRRQIGPQGVTPETAPEWFMGRKGKETYAAGKGQRAVRKVMKDVYNALLNKIQDPVNAAEGGNRKAADIVGLPDVMRSAMDNAAAGLATKYEAVIAVQSMRMIEEWLRTVGKDMELKHWGFSSKLFKKYGDAILAVIKDNPYGRGFNDLFVYKGDPKVLQRMEKEIARQLKGL